MSRSPRKIKYTKEFLAPIISDHASWGSVLFALGLPCTGGNYRLIQRHVSAHEIDSSHFKGHAWNKGLTASDDVRIRRIVEDNIPDASTILTDKSISTSRQIRRALLREGVAYQCVECDNEGTWRGKPLTLHVDHINGTPSDNRRENLRFICPNCHQQTPTWGKRKK